MNRTTRIAIAAALLAIFIGLLVLWHQKAEILPILGTPPVAPPTPEVAAAPPPAPVAEPAPLPEPAATETPLASESIGDALTKLFGQKAALSLLQLDDFQHRFAATTDNLSRQGATSKLWPVNPTPGRFTVIERDGRSFISPDNERRYVPLVVMAEQVNIEQAADLYVQLLPALQSAYEQLGFPNQRFHTRLMTTIDHLLATPDVSKPIEVQLTEVKGSVPSTRPWVRYEYVDPALEQASAGQKILLRVGAVNHRRLKAVLVNFRKAVNARVATR